MQNDIARFFISNPLPLHNTVRNAVLSLRGNSQFPGIPFIFHITYIYPESIPQLYLPLTTV